MLDNLSRAWSGMTEFSGMSGKAEFFTYLVFAAAVGPALAVLAFCFSSFYEFNMPHYLLNMAPFELACAVLAVCHFPLFALAARRMRAAGYSPWLAALAVIPVVGIATITFLASKPDKASWEPVYTTSVATEQSPPKSDSGSLVP